MPAPEAVVDRRYLLASMWASGVLGALGVVWGIASRSQMVLLDGAYAVVGILLSWLLLRASSLAERGPTAKYPYGFQAATPAAVGIQGFVLLATLLYAMYEAVLSIRSGGSEVTAGWAIAYGVIITAASIVFTSWITRAAGASDVLIAESSAWRLATWRGVGMVIGFAALAVIERSSWSDVGPYVDPVMVLVSCALLVGSPLAMIRGTVVELLEGAPGAHILDPIVRALDEVRAEHGFDEPELYVAKVGPKLYVEVAASADADMTITQEQTARDQLKQLLEPVPYDIWLTLELRPRPSHAP